LASAGAARSAFGRCSTRARAAGAALAAAAAARIRRATAYGQAHREGRHQDQPECTTSIGSLTDHW
jgi:hypothetical protein